MSRLHRGPLRFLITEIVSGAYSPGDALPREADLAEEFDVSRGVAREFIRALEERGLISVRHGRGATVNPSTNWDALDADVLAALLEGPQSADVLADFLEARRLLEIEAAGLAAERAEETEIEQMVATYADMEALAEKALKHASAESQYHEADIAFHRRLLEATRNSMLVALAGRIHNAMLEARYPLARPNLRSNRTLPEHKRILDAVAKHDPKAARKAMAAHLASIEEFLKEYADEQDALSPSPR